jgi:hypothetical protein
MRLIKYHILKFVFFILVSILFQHSEVASSVTWDGVAETLVWTTTTNWSGDAILVAVDDVIFNTDGTFIKVE